jgi:hypothetical protein
VYKYIYIYQIQDARFKAGMIYMSSEKRRKVYYRRLPKREIFARENEPQARVKKGRIGYKFLSEFKDPTGQPDQKQGKYWGQN